MLRFRPGSVSTPELLMGPETRMKGGRVMGFGWGWAEGWMREMEVKVKLSGANTEKKTYFHKTNLWTEILFILTTGKNFKNHNMSLVDGWPTQISELNCRTYFMPTSNWPPIGRKIWGHSIASQLLCYLKIKKHDVVGIVSCRCC